VTALDKALRFVLDAEGGDRITNDPADPGGLTKFGISKRAYPALDIAALTEGDAAAIYVRDYWDKCHCSELPNPVAIIVFDAAVNQGVSAATKMLQEAIGTTPDGVIGLRTLEGAWAKGDALLPELVARRALAYARLPTVGRFGLGWFRRLARVHQLSLEG
jgi:lysozyme family protein